MVEVSFATTVPGIGHISGRVTSPLRTYLVDDKHTGATPVVLHILSLGQYSSPHLQSAVDAVDVHAAGSVGWVATGAPALAPGLGAPVPTAVVKEASGVLFTSAKAVVSLTCREPLISHAVMPSAAPPVTLRLEVVNKKPSTAVATAAR